MERTLLHRLPDIIVLARQRARELDPRQRTVRSTSGSRPTGGAPRAGNSDEHQVTLLGGSGLSVLVGLLAGIGRVHSVVASGVPFIWLQDSGQTGRAEACDATPLQRETTYLIDLATRLFLARELLREDGWLAAQLPHSPDRCMERLLQTVFGRVWGLAPVSVHGPQRFLVGVGLAASEPLAAGALPACAHPLPALVQRFTRVGDPVLVLDADASATAWVASLERHWIFQQADSLRLARVREQVVAHQRLAGSVLRAQEPARDWAVMS